jgi:hypothetical protein
VRHIKYVRRPGKAKKKRRRQAERLPGQPFEILKRAGIGQSGIDEKQGQKPRLSEAPFIL